MEIKKQFDGWARSYERKYAYQQWMLSKWENIDGITWPEEKFRIMLNSIKGALALERNHSFVDLGCGGGWILEHLQKDAAGAIGLDFAYSMLAVGKRINPQQRWVCADIAKLPFGDESFDRALCYFVFINMMEDQVINDSLREIVRILKKGGVALIGQIPDASQSEEFDRAKSAYVKFCQDNFPTKENLRDDHWVPIRLFERRDISKILDQMEVSYQMRDSFNPFYHKGQPKEVGWRFDIVLKKE